MNSLSSEQLEAFPSPQELNKRCKSLATLEAILSPDWEFRYYSYQISWSESEELCEMRDGEGDHLFILFSPDGVCLNGFAKASKLNGWKRVEVEEKKTFAEKLFGSKKQPRFELVQEVSKGILASLPEVFHEFIFGDPVCSIGTTFCIWNAGGQWQTGELHLPNDSLKDGSRSLLHLLDGNPSTFKVWAEEYYDETFENRELSLELVEEVYSGAVLTRELVLAINPDLEDFDQLRSDLDEIGRAYEF